MKRQEGFTLLEVLIAFSVLSVGVGALAQLSMLAIRAADNARRASVASVAADQKLETFNALSWGYDDFGVAVQDAALGVSTGDSLARNSDGYFDYLDAAGRVVDEGGEDADDKRAFVRRWSIQPMPGHPLTTIVIEVLVVPMLSGSDPPSSRALQRGARRVTVRTRRSLGSTP
jgi:prepilin-type N-terminal cleavage/methylation domain-containing protein